MEPWTNGAKLGYIITTALLGCAVIAGHMAWEEVPTHAVVAQSPQALSQTVDIVLRSERRSDYYRLFDPAAIDSALAGATLRTSGGIDVRSMQISADSARVMVRRARWDTDHLPGIRVHAAMDVVGNASKTRGEDTVWLEMPGLLRLAERGDYAPRIVYASEYPMDHPSIAIFTHYESFAEMERARIPWLALWVGASLLLVTVAVRVMLKMIGADAATWRRTLRLALGRSGQQSPGATRRHGKKVR